MKMITWTIDDVVEELTKVKKLYGNIPVLFYMERPVAVMPVRSIGDMHIVYGEGEREVQRSVALGAYPVPPCMGCALCKLH